MMFNNNLLANSPFIGGNDMRLGIYGAAIVLLGALAPAAVAQAQSDFFNGKTITVDIGASVGGGFDAYGRIIAEYLGRHVPGSPVVTPQNRPGAGGRVSANWLYNVAPKDGTSIGVFGGWIAFEPLWGLKGVQFDATKFNWLGNANREVSTCGFWRNSKGTSLDALKSGPVMVGSYGPTTSMTQDAVALNALLGTKIKVIEGYKGTRDVVLAAERGEVDGSCGLWMSSVKSQYKRFLDSGELRLVVQMGLERHPELPNVPNAADLIKNEEDRRAFNLIFGQLEVARPIAAPPGVPADRVAILRKALSDTLADPEFIATATKRGLEVRPLGGVEMQALVLGIYSAPQPLVRRVKEIMGY
jgi:tripartite-type tricarboxylate transporter receptor subunit TctC